MSRSSRLARALQSGELAFLNFGRSLSVEQAKLQSSPERIYRGCSLLVFLFILPGRRSACPAAGSAFISAAYEIASRTESFTATATRATEHARRSKRYGLIRVPCGLQSTEVIVSDLARGKVLWRCLVPVIAGEVARITATHWTPSASSVCLLTKTLHFLFMLLAKHLEERVRY